MQLVHSDARIYIAGHRGMVGASIVKHLRHKGFENLLLHTHDELDLRDQGAVGRFFEAEKPEFVVLAAAKVGGILANSTYPADFIYDNLAIELNVIRASFEAKVQRLVFLGSSCIYPKLAPQPVREEHLLSGPLEPTNEAYAVAKIAGITLCQAYRRQYGCDFISLMPSNLYGPHDNYDLQTSHVLPALIRKFHEARTPGASTDEPVTLWGTGKPRREFLYSEDLANAVAFILEQPEDRLWAVAPDGTLNVGTGRDLTIRELAELISEVIGNESEIRNDTSKPDGTPRKLLDVSRMNALGWQARTPLREGIRRSYQWFLESYLETA